jgi:hypothetical protein
MTPFFDHIVDYLFKAPKIIQLTWFLSAAFTVIIVGMIIYLSHIRNRLRTKERIQAVYEKKYEQDLIEYLYSGSEDNTITKEQQTIINYLRKCSSSSLKRKLIINTFIKLRNEISGEMADSIQKLYCETGLVDYASIKLKSKKWNIIAKGIKQLTHFEIREVHDEIIQHINHPKREVRLEIQRYLVQVFHFEGLEFLNVLTCQLTEWDQIQLLEILKKFDIQQSQDFTVWLESSNNSVVSFTLKLVKIFNQYEAKDNIAKLIFHPDIQIRIEAIEVLTYFNDTESLAVLKEDFNNRYLNEQVAIFKMLETLFEIKDIPFLLNHINTENFEIKASISKIFKAIDENDGSDLKTLTNNLDYSTDIHLIKAS